MGWLDRFRKRSTNLADGTSITKTLPVGATEEIGVVGESILGGYGDTEARTDKLTVEDYVKMRQTDGTIASMYNILTLPILAAQHTIDADEDDAGEEQADFVRKVLLEPPHKGGMEIPMPIILADTLRAVLEGFRVFEKVYMLEDGKIVYRKLASRDAKDVYLIRAEDGGYGGAHQRVTFKGEYHDKVIPAWKTFLYTYGKDKNFLYGESAFKAASYHYNMKHKLYYLANLSVQAGAIPPKVLSGPANFSPAERSRAQRMVEKLGGVRTTAYIPDALTLTPYKSSEGRIDPQPLIDHHNAEMARSVLAQFLMLGTGSKSGSWALSKDHSDILLTALKGVMQSIEDHINYYLIPDLIDLNFAKPAYPVWHFEDITSDTKDIVLQAFTEMVSTGVLSDVMKQGIEDRVAEALDIDTDQVQKDLDRTKAKKIAAAKAAGVAVDPEGNPLPARQTVEVPPGGTVPSGGDKPSDSKIINQSDEAAGVVPKDPSLAARSASILRDFRNEFPL